MKTLIERTNYCAFMGVINQYNLLHVLALGLNDMRRIDANATIDILDALRVIVEQSEAFYHSNGNEILDQLEGKYNLSNTLEDIIIKTNHELLKRNA